jgi:hypothetical protein
MKNKDSVTVIQMSYQEQCAWGTQLHWQKYFRRVWFCRRAIALEPSARAYNQTWHVIEITMMICRQGRSKLAQE